MAEYSFRLIVTGPFSLPLSDEELLNVTDALGEAGCDDCSVSAHARGLELEFDRVHESLQEAIASAIRDVERAGYTVERNPWLEIAGTWRDNPDVDEVMENIRTYRRELDGDPERI